MTEFNIERRIVLGFIASTEFINQVDGIVNSKTFESAVAKRLYKWCKDYYDKYNKAPGRDIEGIFFEKLKKGLPKDAAEEIEEDILPALSDEFVEEGFNISYLVDQTKIHCQERNLQLYTEQINAMLSEGDVPGATSLAGSYSFVDLSATQALYFDDEKLVMERVDKAFEESANPLFRYPGALGRFLNHQLIRSGFVAFMASEKRGKSYFLLDMMVRAASQKVKVAFFQAGDMTETQQLKRLCIHLAKTPVLKKYTGILYEPVKDCIRNQMDECDKPVRECDFGIFEGLKPGQIKALKKEDLVEALKQNPDYKPCFNCKEYTTKRIGAPWLKRVKIDNPLTSKMAKNTMHKFFKRFRKRIMLSTHANSTLSVGEIKKILSTWEKGYNFVPDLIIIDYADLLITTERNEFRHQQNEIWKQLRNLSQEKHCLVVTATQADAASYDARTLSLKNFSEDKRKYAHVTAMFGMNQDPEGVEKDIGLLRLNELVIREGESSPNATVTILQNLSRGLPVITSYL